MDERRCHGNGIHNNALIVVSLLTLVTGPGWFSWRVRSYAGLTNTCVRAKLMKAPAMVDRFGRSNNYLEVVLKGRKTSQVFSMRKLQEKLNTHVSMIYIVYMLRGLWMSIVFNLGHTRDLERLRMKTQCLIHSATQSVYKKVWLIMNDITHSG